MWGEASHSASILIISINNKEELPDQLKEFVSVPIYKKGGKTDCSNYSEISQKILCNNIHSRLSQ
jgi:hypothetical protein